MISDRILVSALLGAAVSLGAAPDAASGLALCRVGGAGAAATGPPAPRLGPRPRPRGGAGAGSPATGRDACDACDRARTDEDAVSDAGIFG